VLAQLTKAACSTFTSTAKSLAGGDEIIIIYPHYEANVEPGLNEYSLHIFNGFFRNPDPCFRLAVRWKASQEQQEDLNLPPLLAEFSANVCR